MVFILFCAVVFALYLVVSGLFWSLVAVETVVERRIATIYIGVGVALLILGFQEGRIAVERSATGKSLAAAAQVATKATRTSM